MNRFLTHFFRIPLSFCFLSFFLSCGHSNSSVSLSIDSGRKESLRALSPAAKNGLLEGPEQSAWFGSNKLIFSEIKALELELDIRSSEPVSISFAFLFQDDLESSGKLKKKLEPRNLSVLTKAMGSTLIRMTVPVGSELPELHSSSVPCGFAIDLVGVKDSQVSVISCSSVLPETGWSLARRQFWAGFSAQGGTINVENPHNTEIAILPRSCLVIEFAGSTSGIGNIKNQLRQTFETTGIPFSFRLAPFQGKAYVPSFFAGEGSSIRASSTNATQNLEGLRLKHNFSLPIASENTSTSPVYADPRQILLWPQDLWRKPEWEVFAWDRFPSVLIFDTLDYAVQEKLFKRLAFFVEKQGYRGRLWTDADLKGLHGFNAHDYRADSLAEFFDRAEKDNFALNAEEKELRTIAENEGLIQKTSSGYVAGAGAILSVSRQSAGYLRSLFMTHESFHGIYFIDPEYRAFVHEVYSSMDPRAISFLESYFTVVDSLGYDANDQYLMENEFMSYLMQQSINLVASYFTDNIRERFLRYGGNPELADYIASTKASEFVRAATLLNDYAFSRWGLTGGRVSLFVSE